MKAVVYKNAELSVREISEPIPQKGQALLKVLRCGICGSDLHMHSCFEDMRSGLRQSGYRHFPTNKQELVFGHEFCGEVLDHGAGSDKHIKVGTRVCAVPLIRHGQEIDMLGMSSRTPGAYAERVLAQESMLLPIPNGLSDDMAALTEPMALALHAVRRSEVKLDDVAVVVGCGVTGLAVVCMLKAMGVHTVVASDFSAARRQQALRCGADVVTDPSDDAPYANWQPYGFVDDLPTQLQQAAGWADTHKMPVIFECVGLTGVAQTIVDGAPLYSRVVVVGGCRRSDEIESVSVSHKELDIRFAKGYSLLEYREALHLMAEGRVKAEALVTGLVGLDGVLDAFDVLGSTEEHAKILIDPSRQVSKLELH